MGVNSSELNAAKEVTPEQIKMAFGSPEAIIHTNEDAMKVADSVQAQVFKVGNAVYAPFDTKIG